MYSLLPYGQMNEKNYEQGHRKRPLSVNESSTSKFSKHVASFKYSEGRPRRQSPRFKYQGNVNYDEGEEEANEAMSITTGTARKRKLSDYSDSVSNLADRRRSQSSSERLSKCSSGSSQKSRFKYAHLPLLNDVLAPNLLILFVGLNPGISTSQTGHAYAHPSNLFWKLLYSSGITDRRCSPQEDVNMPELFSCGFTNIVERPTRNGSELTKAEMVAGTAAIERKAQEWQPYTCCLVGKGIWEAIFKWKYGRYPSKTEFRYGWQDVSHNMGKTADFEGARVFVAASTSGSSASLRPAEKEAIWKPLGDWAKTRRKAKTDTT